MDSSSAPILSSSPAPISALDPSAASLPAVLAWAQTAPVALAAIADDGAITWANAAFEAWSGCDAAQVVGRPLESLLAPTPWLPAPAATVRRTLRRPGDGAPLACDVRIDPIGPALRLATFVARDADVELADVAARLDFVQSRARIGTWERDVRTQAGRWDAHMFAFFGIDPAGGTPSLAQITQASMPQDGLLDVLHASMRIPGRYSHRYRLATLDGHLRRVRTHWDVLAGADGEPERVVGLVMDDTETHAIAAATDTVAEQMHLAIELAQVSIWRHDLASDRLFLNERAFAMLGRPPRPEGMRVDEIRAFIHPDDLPVVQETFLRVLASHRPEDMQVRYRHADGHWVHVFTRRIAQRDGFGTPIALTGVGLDVTAQVERTQRSQEIARHLEEVMATSGIGVWRIPRDGGTAEWNTQMRALCGIAADEPPPSFREWVERCVHPDDRERVRERGLDWLRNARFSEELAHRIVLPGGEVRHVVARGRVEPEPSPYRVTGVTIDVTERERALAALRAATERSAMATRAAGIGIWEWDSDTGESRWDDEMFVLRGRLPRADGPTLEEMSEFVHVDDRHYVNDQIHSARIEDRPAYYEFRVLWPDASVHWIASRSLPVRDERGRTVMRLGVNWDVTEARAAAAARQERALVLRESQAKSELLARMSHELRTPMNAVLGFTQLLLTDDATAGDGRRTVERRVAGLERDATRRERLQHIRSAGEHLLTLINDVLELSRLDGPDGPQRDVVLQPVQLAPVIAQTLPLVERLAQQHGVGVQAPPSPLWVRADATRLKQVLVNLLTNAIKYNRPGGTVRLDVATDAGRVLLRVSDDGIGMTSAQQHLAFEPFNRAGAERDGVEGTGIGLTIVKALVERMGGRITVTSTPGVGSVFEVCLDAAADAGPLALPTRRLLYVEDNEVNVLIVSELVRRRGDIEFVSVPDGASGVARAAQLLPGLVLVDMQLPDIDGLEVLARLRADPQTAGLRVIALSANAIPADIQRALDAGFDDYWTKPLDFAVFNAAIDRVFGTPVAHQVPSA